MLNNTHRPFHMLEFLFLPSCLIKSQTFAHCWFGSWTNRFRLAISSDCSSRAHKQTSISFSLSSHCYYFWRNFNPLHATIVYSAATSIPDNPENAAEETLKAQTYHWDPGQCSYVSSTIFPNLNSWHQRRNEHQFYYLGIYPEFWWHNDQSLHNQQLRDFLK